MSENACQCGMPLSPATECSCEPGVCIHCCACPPDCGCGCADKCEKERESQEDEKEEEGE